MSAQGSDAIWWLPWRDDGIVDLRAKRGHLCRFAVVQSLTSRTALDPMALGVCRYCEGPLP